MEFTINGSQSAMTYFYYNYSSTQTRVTTFRGFNHRVPLCASNLTFFEPTNDLCYDICPSRHFIDSTYSLCLTCHYSCLNCSAGSSSTACSDCASSDNRQLNSGSCDCSVGYFENGSALCPQCDVSCLTCNETVSCLSCNSSLNRALSSNGTCDCIAGFYDNSTCQECQSSFSQCSLCTFYSSNNTLTCDQCLPNYILDSNYSSCIIDPNASSICGNSII